MGGTEPAAFDLDRRAARGRTTSEPVFKPEPEGGNFGPPVPPMRPTATAPGKFERRTTRLLAASDPTKLVWAGWVKAASGPGPACSELPLSESRRECLGLGGEGRPRRAAA